MNDRSGACRSLARGMDLTCTGGGGNFLKFSAHVRLDPKLWNHRSQVMLFLFGRPSFET